MISKINKKHPITPQRRKIHHNNDNDNNNNNNKNKK